MTETPPRPEAGAAARSSSAFHLLDPRIQRWIWNRRWPALRPAQEQAVAPILAGQTDLVICAATAAGKTEAAFLPICTALLNLQPPLQEPLPTAGSASGSSGVKALYVSPLKALINDQWGRLDELCEHLDIPVHRWHGDVSASRKNALLKHPDGILLITPESLEALFVNHGSQLRLLLAGLRYVVIDEMHAFMGTARGTQLQALLHRTDLVTRGCTPRIGLSATLGDTDQGKRFLRPGRPDRVTPIEEAGNGNELRLQLRGYLSAAPDKPPPTGPTPGIRGSADVTTRDDPDLGLSQSERSDAGDEADASKETTDLPIGEHLFAVLRGKSNLVFANSRRNVEAYTDRLSRMSATHRVPNEFFPHHGNLSRDLREEVEARLRDSSQPTTAVCTSTLELGINIGAVASVAQIGTPPSVAALRQRLGRSGRRAEEPAVLRLYISEPEITPNTHLVDILREQLVQTVAMVDLLLESWFEPLAEGHLHLSTLIQQVLSLTAQHGGVHAADAYTALCRTGPFHNITQTVFAQLLRDMGTAQLLTQASDGLLLPGATGERLVNHYSFYAAFRTPEEYRLIANGRALGTLPIGSPISEGDYLIFGGRRWQILTIDDRQKVIDLLPARGGKVPKFDSNGPAVHAKIRERMLQLYNDTHTPAYLDATARQLLDEGRDNFHRLALHERRVLPTGSGAVLFPWSGDLTHTTIATLLAGQGHTVEHRGLTVTITGADPAGALHAIDRILDTGPPRAEDLADRIGNKTVDKYDHYLGDTLLNTACAARDLDIPTAHSALARLRASSVNNPM